MKYVLSLFAVLVVGSMSTAIAQTPAAPAEKKVEGDGAKAKTASPSRRIPDTLMFTIDELTDIQNRMTTTEETQGGEKQDGPKRIENASLYLSTIVYYGEKDWTIWVNGKPIGPHDDFSEFQITDIGPRYVELLVPLSAQGMSPVRLEPNQTFITKSGIVVEGAWNP